MAKYDWNASVEYRREDRPSLTITGSGSVEANTAADAELAAREYVERSYTTVRGLHVSPRS